MNRKVVIRTIICCWSALFVCAIIKLCGGNWFEVASGSGNFLKFCNYADNHLWLKYTLNCAMALILNSLCLLAIMSRKRFTKLQMAIFFPLIIFMSIIGWYSSITNTILSFVLYFIPIFFLKDKIGIRILKCVMGIVLIIAFQFISLFIKNVGTLFVNTENTITEIILNLDSLIMVGLYYLYSNYFKLKKLEKGGN